MLVDTHCHNLSEKIVKDAIDSGVTRLINIGTSLKDNEEVILATQRFPGVYGAIGIYPNNEQGENIENLIAALEEQITKTQKVVGVGECGLDITEWSGQRPVPEQVELFREQIRLASKYNLPVVIHNRNADDAVLKILTELSSDISVCGVAHCFVSAWDVAKRFLDLGFYISFSGIITYRSGASIHETVKKVPTDRFVVETDAPYLPPQLADGKRPKTNEPKYVRIVAEKVAELRNLPIEEIEALSYQNSCNLFKI